MRFIRGRLIVILVVASIVIFGEMALGNASAKNQELIQSPIKITEAFKNIPYNPDMARDREDSDRGKLGKNITPDKSRIPSNPYTTHSGNEADEKDIDEFAWKDFVALNWPSDCQGKPLNDKRIGEAPEAPRVWELYPSPKDVFPPNGEIPRSLDKLAEDKKCLGDGKGLEIEYKPNLRLTETGELAEKQEYSEFKIASRKDLLDEAYGELKSELNIDGQLVSISVENLKEAIKIPLVDRQGNYIINEVRINPVEYKQISDNQWYDANQLVELIKSNKQFNLACSEGYESQSEKYCGENHEAEGAIEIKAVWRVFDDRHSPEYKATYYTTTRKIVIPDGNLTGKYKVLPEVELGLIGFHIMHKTSRFGWVWSTFEHIDNAPLCKPENSPEKTRAYTLYNNECKTENCEENWPYVKEPYLWNISNKEPKAVTIEGLEGIAVRDRRSEIKDQVPSQICRANKIRVSATEENGKWQNSLKDIDRSSVWQYYQLIGTQWLRNPEFPYSNKEVRRREIKPKCPPLTNAALEPYAQGVSCIVCHTSARLLVKGNFCQLNGEPKNCADFSFLMDNVQLKEPIPVKPN